MRVEVSGLEPPTSTLRTSFVHPPEQGLRERTSWYRRCIPLTLPQVSSHYRKISSFKVTHYRRKEPLRATVIAMKQPGPACE
jgi:hypothetical protein